MTSARARSGANESASGNSTRSRAGATPFRRPASTAAAARALQVLGLRQVRAGWASRPRVRGGEEAVEVVAHRARGGERDQVRGALGPRLAGHRAAEGAEHQRCRPATPATAPTASGSAWPAVARQAPQQPVGKAGGAPIAASPPGSMPASARRPATRPGARDAIRIGSPASSELDRGSAASARWAGSSARSKTAEGDGRFASSASPPPGGRDVDDRRSGLAGELERATRDARASPVPRRARARQMAAGRGLEVRVAERALELTRRRARRACVGPRRASAPDLDEEDCPRRRPLAPGAARRSRRRPPPRPRARRRRPEARSRGSRARSRRSRRRAHPGGRADLERPTDHRHRGDGGRSLTSARPPSTLELDPVARPARQRGLDRRLRRAARRRARARPPRPRRRRASASSRRRASWRQRSRPRAGAPAALPSSSTDAWPRSSHRSSRIGSSAAARGATGIGGRPGSTAGASSRTSTGPSTVDLGAAARAAGQGAARRVLGVAADVAARAPARAASPAVQSA